MHNFLVIGYHQDAYMYMYTCTLDIICDHVMVSRMAILKTHNSLLKHTSKWTRVLMSISLHCGYCTTLPPTWQWNQTRPAEVWRTCGLWLHYSPLPGPQRRSSGYDGSVLLLWLATGKTISKCFVHVHVYTCSTNTVTDVLHVWYARLIYEISWCSSLLWSTLVSGIYSFLMHISLTCTAGEG